MTKGQRKMTDFVLMPEEATPEMEQAAEKYWNDRKFKALSDDPRTWKGLYAAMRAVAPAVQGEPVYLYRRRGLRNFVTCNYDQYAELSGKPHLFETKVLYTIPQPTFTVGTDLSDGKLSVVVMKHENGITWVIHSEVIQLAEQQPELAKYQPCGCVICTCEHETQCQGCGGHHCGTHPVGQFSNPVYQQSTEQKPVPDVTQLVEALEEIIHPVRFMQERLEEGERLNGMAAVQLAEDASYLRGIAIAALAAYHKEGRT